MDIQMNQTQHIDAGVRDQFEHYNSEQRAFTLEELARLTPSESIAM